MSITSENFFDDGLISFEFSAAADGPDTREPPTGADINPQSLPPGGGNNNPQLSLNNVPKEAVTLAFVLSDLQCGHCA